MPHSFVKATKVQTEPRITITRIPTPKKPVANLIKQFKLVNYDSGVVKYEHNFLDWLLILNETEPISVLLYNNRESTEQIVLNQLLLKDPFCA